MTDLARIRLGCWRSFNENFSYRSAIVADYCTIGHTVRAQVPTGNGTHTDWDGDYTSVDDGAINDADTITSTSVGEKETFTAPNYSSTPIGSVIKAVAVTARARNDGGASPQNFTPILRIGSTDYLATGSPPLNSGFSGTCVIFPEDPSTSLDWASVTNVNTEFGVVSET